MKIRTLTFVLVLLLCSTAVWAQKSATAGDPAKEYKDLVAKLKSGDTKIDYTALRMAFTKTADYTTSFIIKPFRQPGCDEALRTVEERTDSIYIDMVVQAVASKCYEEKGKKDKAEFHKAVAKGLIYSLLGSGDGRSAGTAFTVIRLSEQDVAIQALGRKPGPWTRSNIHGHSINIMTAIDPETNEQELTFFNTDIPHQTKVNGLFR